MLNPVHHAINLISIPAICWLSLLPIIVFLAHQLPHFKTSLRPKGCRRLGLAADQSNLRDEFDPKYSHGVPESSVDVDGRPSWRIKSLFTYPIKSCAGIELDVSDVERTGLTHDRQFCFAEYISPSPGTVSSPAHTQWTMRTMRDGQFSRMALIRPEIWIPDPTASDYSSDLEEVKSHGVMIIYYPRVPSWRNGLLAYLEHIAITLGLLHAEQSFRVPLSPPSDLLSNYPSTRVKVWKDSPFAYDYAQHIPPSLLDFLCAPGNESSSSRGPLTLFRVHPSYHREIFRCAPRKETLGFQPITGFADAYPLHLLNLASVRDVAARCALSIAHLSIRRFRANIIIQGPKAFAEDHWKRIQIYSRSGSYKNKEVDKDAVRGIEIYASCRTMRCKLPNVDPDTGIRHLNEPDQTLRSYRRIDPGDWNYAALGMQLVPAVQSIPPSPPTPTLVL
ncbi:hypothetical protein EYZ11_005973 [Aspergillus tanneri]|nr:hypothetical protein EYZ11_005973 [Aspergillus tanneri]